MTDTWTIEGWQVLDNGWHNVTDSTTGTYVGRSEFFSGLTPGSEVNVHRTTYFTPDGTVSHVSHFADRGGAALSIHDLSDLRLDEDDDDRWHPADSGTSPGTVYGF